MTCNSIRFPGGIYGFVYVVLHRMILCSFTFVYRIGRERAVLSLFFAFLRP